ncbi:unnamed protein product, partial [Polarella glacialis]
APARRRPRPGRGGGRRGVPGLRPWPRLRRLSAVSWLALHCRFWPRGPCSELCPGLQGGGHHLRRRQWRRRVASSRGAGQRREPRARRRRLLGFGHAAPRLRRLRSVACGQGPGGWL